MRGRPLRFPLVLACMLAAGAAAAQQKPVQGPDLPLPVPSTGAAADMIMPTGPQRSYLGPDVPVDLAFGAFHRVRSGQYLQDGDLRRFQCPYRIEQGFDDYAGTGKSFADGTLAVFDLLGQFDLALAIEQRDHAHFAQVGSHRIIALVERGGKIQVGQVFGFFFALL